MNTHVAPLPTEQVLCPQCKGHGEVWTEVRDEFDVPWFKPCPTCLGFETISYIYYIALTDFDHEYDE